jgi:hypothetical protein
MEDFETKKKSANPYSKLATSIHWHERKTHYDAIDVARFLIRIGFHCADLTCLVALPLNGESSLFQASDINGGRDKSKMEKSVVEIANVFFWGARRD